MTADDDRIGVVLVSFYGAGQQHHQRLMYYPALKANPHFRILGVTESPTAGDRALQHTKQEAERFGLPFYDFDDAMRLPGARLAIMCGLLEDRVSAVSAVAAAGLNMVIDKPMAGSLADAAAITDIVRTAGVLALPAHHIRFHPVLRSAATAINEGGIGRPQGFQADFFARGGPGVYPGGEIANFALYVVDALHAMLGAWPATVSTLESPAFYGGLVEDFAVLSLTYADGVIGDVAIGRVPSEGDGFFRHKYTVVGSDGTVMADAAGPALTVASAALQRKRFGETSLGGFFDHVWSAVNGYAECALSPSSAVATAAVVEAAHESARRRTPVSVTYS